MSPADVTGLVLLFGVPVGFGVALHLLAPGTRSGDCPCPRCKRQIKEKKS